MWFMRSRGRDHNQILDSMLNIKRDQLAARCPSLVEANPDELVVDATGVFCKGQRIYSAYLDCSTYQLEYRIAEFPSALLDHIQNGRMKVFSSPLSILAENKLNLPILADPANSWAFSPEEQDVIGRCLPSELVALALIMQSKCLERERYVLKRGAGRAGNATIIGATTSANEFVNAVRNGIGEGGWNVQDMFAQWQCRNAGYKA